MRRAIHGVVAGVLTDKFCFHLPLYRQHQRLAMCGIKVARSTLTTWVHRACALLAPIYEAQLRHILLSKTLAMDETPIRAGPAKNKGKMKTAWYWPVYGEDDEVAFTFSSTHGRAHIDKVLAAFKGTLLTDGAPAYARFARERAELVHAQCWMQYPEFGFIRSSRPLALSVKGFCCQMTPHKTVVSTGNPGRRGGRVWVSKALAALGRYQPAPRTHRVLGASSADSS